jgi:hypothetical protein
MDLLAIYSTEPVPVGLYWHLPLIATTQRSIWARIAWVIVRRLNAPTNHAKERGDCEQSTADRYPVRPFTEHCICSLLIRSSSIGFLISMTVYSYGDMQESSMGITLAARISPTRHGMAQQFDDRQKHLSVDPEQ